MTTGHKHREVRVKRDGWPYRVLRKPLLVLSDKHTAYVDRSRLVFGVRTSTRDHHEEYTLSLLGVLHALTGLTLRYEDPETGS